MGEAPQVIQRGVGIGNVRLGATPTELRALLGPPDRIEGPASDLEDEWWYYDALQLELSIDRDSERLDGITSNSSAALFRGARIVGLTEEELLAGRFGGAGPPELDDDFEEFGRDYIWRDLEMSCWVDPGTGCVTSVHVMCFYGADDEPIWPGD